MNGERQALRVRIHRPVPTALICGVSGQDGAYLAAHLLSLGYRVIGTSRDAGTCDRSGLAALGIQKRVEIESLDPVAAPAVRELLERVRPEEIYHLSGQSSVAMSYTHPAEAFRSIAQSTSNILETLRIGGLPCRLFVAGSVAMYGDTRGRTIDESLRPRPVDPYGLAKATAHGLVEQYRRLHGVHACTGILGNHESPLRPERFVTQKVAAAACRIAGGDTAPLTLGDLSIERDWGWAEEYVVAMHAMLQLDAPEDLVLASGSTVKLEALVSAAFSQAGLDWRRHVVSDPSLARPGEARRQAADASRAAERIGWRATVSGPEVARRMVEARLASSVGTARRAA